MLYNFIIYIVLYTGVAYTNNCTLLIGFWHKCSAYVYTKIQ